MTAVNASNNLYGIGGKEGFLYLTGGKEGFLGSPYFRYPESSTGSAHRHLVTGKIQNLDLAGET